jgi:hypothetical protein
VTGIVRARARRAATALVALSLAVLLPLPAASLAAEPVPRPPRPDAGQLADVPLLAYYYIWYETASWDRAKTDEPLLGRYTSDDEAVMRRHIGWAKAAGIDGFLVGWKSTALLDKRLRRLVAIANELDFHLGIVYQALDFEREPLEPERIAEDLDWFSAEFADAPAFGLWEKPLVIWSGTWRFTEAQVEEVAARRRERLLILGSERDTEGIERLAGLVDGEAYYWASANPYTHPGYEDRLLEMARATREAGGRWLAPAAPGFDARLLGGTSVVDREGGGTLRRELDAAMATIPDAVGLISWNEFSENTHVEPSRQHGQASLDLLASLAALPPLQLPDFDSSAPEGVDASWTGRAMALLAVLAAVLVGVVATYRRTRARREAADPRPPVPRVTSPP